MGFFPPIAQKKNTWSTRLGCLLRIMGENVAHNSGESRVFVDSRKHALSVSSRRLRTGKTRMQPPTIPYILCLSNPEKNLK